VIRPIFHDHKEAIEAHLTVGFAALAINRHLQERTGVSITKLVQALRAVRFATVRVNGHETTIDPTSRPLLQTRPSWSGSLRKVTDSVS